MKVAFNGLIIDRHKAGIAQYGDNLIKYLIKNQSIQYSFFLQEFVEFYGGDVIRFKEFKKSYERIFTEQFILPPKYKKYDLVHFMDYSSPVIRIKTPFITTVHDFCFYKYPETFSAGSRKIKEFLVPFSVKRAARILADSESTRTDIIKYFPEAEEKIRVIYPAVLGFHRVEDEEAIEAAKKKYNITGKYILGVGTMEPRKNLVRLIRAFQLISKEIDDVKLVLVGKKGWLYDEIFKEINNDALKDKIVYTGYVEQQDMKSIYSGASCFVYPSLYEGFGLPPLEAMNCGVPVVSSNISSLPEVIGDAGILINPMEIVEIAEAVLKLLFDEKLRNNLISKGLKQSEKFKWEKTTNKIFEVYDEILR
jgi:glycosyltransferase involved in cell wall biosynthesis